MMRAKYLILLIVMLTMFSCNNVELNKKNDEVPGVESEYFEGIIEYSIDYKLLNPEISIDRLKNILGTRIVRRFSEGSWREDYYDSYGNWLRTNILNQKEERFYSEFSGKDTIYYIDINKTDYQTTIQQLPDTIINNHPCWAIKSTSINEENEAETVSSTYYISKHLKIDAEWYSNYINGGYDRIYRIAPGIEYQTRYSNNAHFVLIREFVSKRKEDIDDSEFKIDSTKHLKKQSYDK